MDFESRAIFVVSTQGSDHAMSLVAASMKVWRNVSLSACAAARGFQRKLRFRNGTNSKRRNQVSQLGALVVTE
jgi:hypothetical protein